MKACNYTSTLIKMANDNGFTSVCSTGTKVVRMYLCHSCKGKTMLKIRKNDEPKVAHYVCKCGYCKKL